MGKERLYRGHLTENPGVYQAFVNSNRNSAAPVMRSSKHSNE